MPEEVLFEFELERNEESDGGDSDQNGELAIE